MSKQTYCQQLKAYAEENGVEFKKSWNQEKVIEALLAAGYEIPEPAGEESLSDEVESIVNETLNEMSDEIEDMVDEAFEDAVNGIDPFADDTPEEVEEEGETASAVKYQETPFSKEVKKALVGLRMEFNKAKTDLAKKNVLQKAQVIRKEINQKKDQLALIHLLQWLRARKLLSTKDRYTLNYFEMLECEDMCEHHQKLSAAGHHLELGRAYRFKSDFDPNKGADGAEVYTVYIPRVIEPEEQISKALDRKMRKGFMPEAKDYADPKVLVSMSQFVESEFIKYFRIL